MKGQVNTVGSDRFVVSNSAPPLEWECVRILSPQTVTALGLTPLSEEGRGHEAMAVEADDGNWYSMREVLDKLAVSRGKPTEGGA